MCVGIVQDGLKQRTVHKWFCGPRIANSLGNLRVDKLEFLARSRTYGAFMTTGYKIYSSLLNNKLPVDGTNPLCRALRTRFFVRHFLAKFVLQICFKKRSYVKKIRVLRANSTVVKENTKTITLMSHDSYYMSHITSSIIRRVIKTFC